MDRTWLMNSRGLAQKVINASLPAEEQIKDCGASRQCPNCRYLIDNSDISRDWPGLPAGVKFEPSDVELLDHLAAKQGQGDVEPHIYIDEFIPTLDGNDGICSTHPENLPGAKRDGSCIHFFYRISMAYASGKRKRRRIQGQESTANRCVRWHKTGKTKPVMEHGVQKGFKKIMVLYAASKRGSKPDKCNWVMHQYHLGTDEDEKDGELVVSKLFYQPQKDGEKDEASLVIEESEIKTVRSDPWTPKTTTPDLAWPEKTPSSDCLSDDNFMESLLQDSEWLKETFNSSYEARLDNKTEYSTCLAADCEPFGLSQPDPLICKEMVDVSSPFDVLSTKTPSSAQVVQNLSDVHEVDSNSYCGISELDGIELDTPPDFNELIFASQDSVFDWLDR